MMSVLMMHLASLHNMYNAYILQSSHVMLCTSHSPRWFLWSAHKVQMLVITFNFIFLTRLSRTICVLRVQNSEMDVHWRYLHVMYFIYGVLQHCGNRFAGYLHRHRDVSQEKNSCKIAFVLSIELPLKFSESYNSPNRWKTAIVNLNTFMLKYFVPIFYPPEWVSNCSFYMTALRVKSMQKRRRLMHRKCDGECNALVIKVESEICMWETHLETWLYQSRDCFQNMFVLGLLQNKTAVLKMLILPKTRTM